MSGDVGIEVHDKFWETFFANVHTPILFLEDFRKIPNEVLKTFGLPTYSYVDKSDYSLNAFITRATGMNMFQVFGIISLAFLASLVLVVIILPNVYFKLMLAADKAADHKQRLKLGLPSSASREDQLKFLMERIDEAMDDFGERLAEDRRRRDRLNGTSEIEADDGTNLDYVSPSVALYEIRSSDLEKKRNEVEASPITEDVEDSVRRMGYFGTKLSTVPASLNVKRGRNVYVRDQR